MYVGGSSNVAGGTGSFTVSNSGVATISGTIKIWNSAGSTVSLNGGTLNVGLIDTSAGSPSQVQWTAGTLNVTNSTIMVDPTQVSADTNFGGILSIGSTQTLEASNGSSEIVGNIGSAALNQSGGTNTITGGLSIASNADATGTYNFSGGTLSVTGGAGETIANEGTATFSQTAGLNNISAGALYIANSAGSNGLYSLASAGALTVKGNEYVGNGGNGSFVQVGGTNAISETYSLFLGANGGSNGIYALTGGTLEVSGLVVTDNGEVIGDAGSGTFIQSGGTNTGAVSLNLGAAPGGTGLYSLSGSGVLNVLAEEFVADSGSTASGSTATFIQVGGTNNSGALAIGENAHDQGTYNLSGGSLVAVGKDPGGESIGFAGTGIFSQTGGTNSTSALFLGATTGANGTYSLNRA
jgi:hypothetical protein